MGQKIKVGQSIYCTGVFLELQKDNTWKVMKFDGDCYHEGAEVSGQSAIPKNNHPKIVDINEEESK